MHNISATNPIYRRHKRLLPRLMAERRLVVPRLQGLFPRSMSDQEARRTLLNALSVPNDYLPHLVDYLGKVGHDGEPESLLWAFHGPSCDMNESYKEAMNEYIQDILTSESLFEPGQPVPFILTPVELSYAEAWLTLLESDGRFKNGLNAAP